MVPQCQCNRIECRLACPFPNRRWLRQAAKRQVEALQAKFKAHHHEMSAKAGDPAALPRFGGVQEMFGQFSSFGDVALVHAR